MHRKVLHLRLVAVSLIVCSVLMASCKPAKATVAVYAVILRGSSAEDARISAAFAAALAEIRAETLTLRPEKPRAALQAELVADCVTRGVAGIAIDPLDTETLRDPLQAAMAAGIPVVTLGAVPGLGGKALALQPWDMAALAAQLADALKAVTDPSAQFAILAGEATDDETNLLLEQFKKALGASRAPVRLAYSGSGRDRGATAVSGLLTAYPKLACIVALTGPGLAAAARTVADRAKGGKPLVIGPGDPLEMASYLESGLCPRLFARNPEDTGLLAALALRSLAIGKITGKPGESFDAGRLGARTLSSPWTEGLSADAAPATNAVPATTSSAEIPGPAPFAVDKAALAGYRSVP